MSARKTILVLHDPGDTPPDLQALVDALERQGARVVVRRCAEPYGDVLDDMVAADTVLFWR